jgi:hypothetical protein
MKEGYLRYGLVVVALTVAAAPATAHQHRTGKGQTDVAATNTFSGQCDMSGRVSFQPALTNQPQTVSQSASVAGTCSGQFIDGRGRTHQLSDSPAGVSETSQSPNATCSGGTSTGRAVISFRYGKIHAGFQEERAGAGAVITLTGDAGGSVTALVTASTSEDPLSILMRCAGSGLDSVRIDTHDTTTPSISG